MARIGPAACLAVALLACAISAQEQGKNKLNLGPLSLGPISVGYDEGLGARAYFSDKIGVNLGLAYYVKGADTIGYHQVHCFAWKLGGEFVLGSWEKFKLNSFLEWREELTQKHTFTGGLGDSGRVLGDEGVVTHMRYNQWNTIFRLGLRPELFINDRVSIDYKFGLQYTYHAPDYKVNKAASGTESRKNSYAEFGVYETRLPDTRDNYSAVFTSRSVILAFGVNFYIIK